MGQIRPVATAISEKQVLCQPEPIRRTTNRVAVCTAWGTVTALRPRYDDQVCFSLLKMPSHADSGVKM